MQLQWCCDGEAKEGEQKCEMHFHLSQPWLSGELALGDEHSES